MGEPEGDPKAAFVSVKSTLPIFPRSSERQDFATERLIIRPFRQEDLEGLHGLRTQIEVMVNTGQGRNDRDRDETQKKLELHLPPNDLTTFNCAILDRASGAFIGSGGCHRIAAGFGWPEIGYMFRTEYWGKGLATEFVRGFLELYVKLPRREAEVLVHPATVAAGAERSEELLVALTTYDNVQSQRILAKAGFERFLEFTEPDLRDPSVNVGLYGFRWYPTRGAKGGD